MFSPLDIKQVKHKVIWPFGVDSFYNSTKANLQYTEDIRTIPNDSAQLLGHIQFTQPVSANTEIYTFLSILPNINSGVSAIHSMVALIYTMATES